MSLNILIIDDDPQTYETIKSILQLKTSQVDAYFSFNDSSDINYNQYDLIFLELIMAHKDGIIILRELADLGFSGQLIIMGSVENSILNSAQELAKEHKLNVLPHLNKPFKATDIEDAYDAADSFIKVQQRTITAKKQLSLTEIEHAIKNDLLLIEYQPQLDLISHRVIGVEALLRIAGKKEEVFYPDQFIKTAENDELIIQLTQSMIKKALAQFRRVLLDGYRLTLSLNVSTYDLQNIDFADWLVETTETYEIPTSHIIIEVTEINPTYSLTSVLDVLARLRIKGFKVSIDSFGVGSTSLDYVQRLPATELKIDKSLISDLDNKKSLILVKNTILMGEELDLDIIAVGVESQRTEDFLLKLGCRMAQGYLYSKPISIHRLSRLLKLKQAPVSVDTLCQETQASDTKTVEVKLTPKKTTQDTKNLNSFNEQLNIINSIESNQLLAYVIPLTGQYSFIGQSIQLGARLALNAAFNKIPNLKLGIEFFDDQSEIDFTLKLCENLPQKTLALVEPAFALFHSKKFLEHIVKTDLPVIAPFNGADVLRKEKASAIFNIKPSIHDELQEILNTIKPKQGKKVFALTKGRAVTELTKQLLGTPNCILIEYDPEELTQTVKRINEISPSCIVFFGSAKTLVHLIEGLNNPHIEYYATSLIGTGMVKKFITRTAKVKLTITEPLPDFQADSEASHSFAHAIKGAKNQFEIEDKYINSISFESFLVTKLLIRLYRKNNQSLTRRGLKREIENLFGYDLGLDAPLTWTPENRQLLHKIYRCKI